jgi:hypothetical protein
MLTQLLLLLLLLLLSIRRKVESSFNLVLHIHRSNAQIGAESRPLRWQMSARVCLRLNIAAQRKLSNTANTGEENLAS